MKIDNFTYEMSELFDHPELTYDGLTAILNLPHMRETVEWRTEYFRDMIVDAASRYNNYLSKNNTAPPLKVLAGAIHRTQLEICRGYLSIRDVAGALGLREETVGNYSRFFRTNESV